MIDRMPPDGRRAMTLGKPSASIIMLALKGPPNGEVVAVEKSTATTSECQQAYDESVVADVNVSFHVSMSVTMAYA